MSAGRLPRTGFRRGLRVLGVALVGVLAVSCAQPGRDAGTVYWREAPRASALGTDAAVTAIQWPHIGAAPLSDPRFVRFVREARATPDVGRTIAGALRYLDDTQIRDRAGRHSSHFDTCAPDGDGCSSVILLNTLTRGYVERDSQSLGISIRNVAGEWANTIHVLPDVLGDADGEVGIAIQDSNVFVTAGVLYPLYFLDEQRLPPEARLAARTRSLGVASLARYRRGPAYSFWTEIPGETSPAPRTGPLNLPIHSVRRLAAALSGPLFPLWSLVTAGLNVNVEDWVRLVLDETRNPLGFDAIFNLPNDADDTALVVALQRLHSRLQPGDGVHPDLPALHTLTRYRDTGRQQRDPRNLAAGAVDSGAFLTWLTDEERGVFSAPEAGVIPLAVNNVDCVVNANALFSLSINGGRGWAGYAPARDFLLSAVRSGAWADSCVLYYPQLMMLPYTLSRAYREGGMTADPVMRAAMGQLLRDLLRLQQDDGGFPGGGDPTRDLSTALATSALLNIGAAVAPENGLFNAYQHAVARGVRYLLDHRRDHPLGFAPPGSTGEGPYGNRGYRWGSGVLFAGSYGDLAHWRSEAYSTAIALEALIKFALAYDLTGATLLGGGRLQVGPDGIEDFAIAPR